MANTQCCYFNRSWGGSPVADTLGARERASPSHSAPRVWLPGCPHPVRKCLAAPGSRGAGLIRRERSQWTLCSCPGMGKWGCSWARSRALGRARPEHPPPSPCPEPGPSTLRPWLEDAFQRRSASSPWHLCPRTQYRVAHIHTYPRARHTDTHVHSQVFAGGRPHIHIHVRPRVWVHLCTCATGPEGWAPLVQLPTHSPVLTMHPH